MKSELIYEEWRPIPGYFELYDASNFGRVRSLDRLVKYSNGKIVFHKGGILSPGKNTKGYLTVILCKDGKKKCFRVHRLVWEAFNGIIPDGYEVNHINEIKTDNSLWNINLMTHIENNNYGTRTQKAKEKLTNGKLSDPVLQLTLDGVLVKEWPSLNETGRNGFDQGVVSKCCNGKLKSHKGFKWLKKETYPV